MTSWSGLCQTFRLTHFILYAYRVALDFYVYACIILFSLFFSFFSYLHLYWCVYNNNNNNNNNNNIMWQCMRRHRGLRLCTLVPSLMKALKCKTLGASVMYTVHS